MKTMKVAFKIVANVVAALIIVKCSYDKNVIAVCGWTIIFLRDMKDIINHFKNNSNANP